MLSILWKSEKCKSNELHFTTHKRNEKVNTVIQKKRQPKSQSENCSPKFLNASAFQVWIYRSRDWQKKCISHTCQAKCKHQHTQISHTRNARVNKCYTIHTRTPFLASIFSSLSRSVCSCYFILTTNVTHLNQLFWVRFTLRTSSVCEWGHKKRSDSQKEEILTNTSANRMGDRVKKKRAG